MKTIITLLLISFAYNARSQDDKKDMVVLVNYNYQNTRFYYEHFESNMDIEPLKTSGYSINASFSPKLKDNFYLNFGLGYSKQGQNLFHEGINGAPDRSIADEISYLKIPMLLSIRSFDWHSKIINMNIELGPQFSILSNHTFNIDPYADYSYVLPTMKTFTLDFVGQLTFLVKLSKSIFLTTGLRYDRTITSPIEKTYHYPNGERVVLKAYNRTIGVIFGLSFYFSD